MVAKSKTPGTKKTRKLTVGKLKLKTETVRDLSQSEKKGVKGGTGHTTYLITAVCCARQ